MAEPKNIYELELHESLLVRQSARVMRVPGGWIYSDHQENCGDAACFVPYSNEFLVKRLDEPVSAKPCDDANIPNRSEAESPPPQDAERSP